MECEEKLTTVNTMFEMTKRLLYNSIDTLEYVLDELKNEKCNVKYLIPEIEETLKEFNDEQ